MNETKLQVETEKRSGWLGWVRGTVAQSPLETGNVGNESGYCAKSRLAAEMECEEAWRPSWDEQSARGELKEASGSTEKLSWSRK
jgi:hypothetical protein